MPHPKHLDTTGLQPCCNLQKISPARKKLPPSWGGSMQVAGKDPKNMRSSSRCVTSGATVRGLLLGCHRVRVVSFSPERCHFVSSHRDGNFLASQRLSRCQCVTLSDTDTHREREKTQTLRALSFLSFTYPSIYHCDTVTL